MTAKQMRKTIAALGPWHLDVQVSDEISTRVFLEEPRPEGQEPFEVAFIAPRDGWHQLITSIYPEGLAGRTVLDCACNCGGYSFWMKELGAGDCFGFDVREHWINQAHFLQRARQEESTGLRFEVCDLYDVPSRHSADVDISIFKGLFYHLPDPIGGLKLVADRTRELLVLNTSARVDLPDGMLVASPESVVHPMSGVHGLSWFPTGPDVLVSIMNWLGFTATRCTFFKKTGDGLGRLEILAARDEGTFEHFDARGA